MAKVKKIFKDTYKITESGKFSSVSMYLIIGSDRAILLDSGYGTIDLPKIINKLYSGEVIIINTHGHIDHIGGNNYYDSYMREIDIELYERHSSIEFLNENKLHVFKHTLVNELTEDTIDLGGRILKIYNTPGHTKGSISILDDTNKIFFVGDTFNFICTFLGCDTSTSVDVYRNSLITLRELALENNVKLFYSGHCFKPLKIKALNNYIKCCNKILNSNKKYRYVDMGINKGFMTSYHFCILIWKTKKDN
jgi:glyoxylase-like metal-dependent hydrolase (beta-lactamase superfamily II)